MTDGIVTEIRDMLESINAPQDLKRLSIKDLEQLAAEIRALLVDTVLRQGGHLASNLGAVELTLALDYVFNPPDDKIVFDVGHQAYVHKILTGRREAFAHLRERGGLSGFPRLGESEFDAFSTGHASTAISAALGMARARDLMGDRHAVVAVVGDGALTGGMCYEALNDAGSRKTPLVVVLNDNGMSISRNTGALSAHLTKLRVSRGWLGMKKNVSEALRKVPLCGERLHRGFQRIKNGVRNVLVQDRFFTSLGFRYFGPIDGHDLAGMERIFRRLREMNEPVVVHVVTKKGAGFRQAEEKPDKYHGVAPFLMENGQTRHFAGPSMGCIGGRYLTELAEKNDRVCVITAAMTDSAGFGPFAARYPKRLFDVGIAEEHAVTMAAGMAAAGMRPFVAIYETFLQRAYDQIAEDVCLQNLPVTFLMDRAGLGGEDGPTHHGVLGVSMLRSIPGMQIFAPRCARELQEMIEYALTCAGPVAIRYPRSAPEVEQPFARFVPGTWETLREGKDAALIASSSILAECLRAAKLLQKNGIDAAVINASSIRPLDEKCLKRLSQAGIPVFPVEEHVLPGGFGSAVTEHCRSSGLTSPRDIIALPDRFIAHGARSALLRPCGLDPESIASRVKKAVKP